MPLKIGDFLICEFGNFKCVLVYENNLGINNLKVVKHINGSFGWNEYYTIGILCLCRKLTDEERLELL